MKELNISAVSQRIKKRREELEYSYQQLADLTGLSKSTLQRYETGAIQNIPLNRLQTLCSALRITPGKLIGWEDDTDMENLVKSDINLFKEYDITQEHFAVAVVQQMEILEGKRDRVDLSNIPEKDKEKVKRVFDHLNALLSIPKEKKALAKQYIDYSVALEQQTLKKSISSKLDLLDSKYLIEVDKLLDIFVAAHNNETSA